MVVMSDIKEQNGVYTIDVSCLEVDRILAHLETRVIPDHFSFYMVTGAILYTKSDAVGRGFEYDRFLTFETLESAIEFKLKWL